MTKEPNRTILEELWRRALLRYRQEGLRERLEAEWGSDPYVAQISEKPPTFQPGYIGRRYFEAQARLVLLLQNPGEGRKPEQERSNSIYLAYLESFGRGEIGFEELNDHIADQMLNWDIYKSKGLFQEDRKPRDERSLIAEDVRPSIAEVACLNFFPFKTRGELKRKAHSPLLEHIWTSHVERTLELLEPAVVARVPATNVLPNIATRLRDLPGPPDIFEVGHPRNRKRFSEREQSWRPVTDALRRRTSPWGSVSEA